MSDGPDVLKWEGLELVLFEEIVQILLQHLEDQTSVVLVSEALVGADKIIFIRIFLAEKRIMKWLGWRLGQVFEIPSCVSGLSISLSRSSGRHK